VDISNAQIMPPEPGTFEDVFIRANPAGFWLDMRSLPNDKAGGWLKGPRPMRVITETYISLLPAQFETMVQIPENFDGVVFVKRSTPARPY
jgi:erythromycin esterase-like protein